MELALARAQNPYLRALSALEEGLCALEYSTSANKGGGVRVTLEGISGTLLRRLDIGTKFEDLSTQSVGRANSPS